ncbi:MAG: NUDIX hydrolase [Planctomycetales bacterium]|nr:NUDIX hydrolase [Planctomycetales bacterium]
MPDSDKPRPNQADATRPDGSESTSQPPGLERVAPWRHGPWTVLTRQEMYRDPWVSLVRDNVLRPDGNPGTYCVVTLKPGVTVLALDQDNHVHLTQEFHYGVGRVTLEAVSGGCDGDEQPLVTAQRELREELGLRAGTWTHLGTVDPFTANVVSPTQLYLAEDLELGTAQPEGTEVIERIVISLEEAVERVFRSEISHAPSCEAILRTAWRRR